MKRSIFVCWDPHEKQMLILGGPETREWLAGPAAPAVQDVEREVLHGRVMNEPAKGDRPAPAGCFTPTIVAVMLRQKLTAAFPKETIEVSRGMRVGGITIDYGALT